MALHSSTVSLKPALRSWLPPALLTPLAGWWWWRSGSWPAAAIASFSLFLLTTVFVAPKMHAPVQRTLDRIGNAFLQIITWLVLGSVFALVFIPARFVILVLGRDPMARRFNRDTSSYFETPPPPAANRFKQSF